MKYFIQLLINSGHKYAYIKSIVMQGISRYIYMWERNNLDSGDKKYCPLHLARSFKTNDRKLTKYLSHSNWYTNNKFGYKYKHGWKKWIKRKGPKTPRMGRKNGGQIVE